MEEEERTTNEQAQALPPPPADPFAIGFVCREYTSSGGPSVLTLPKGKMVAVLDEPIAGLYRVQVDSEFTLVPIDLLERMAMISAEPATILLASKVIVRLLVQHSCLTTHAQAGS